MNLVPRKFFLDDFFDDFVPETKNSTNMKCDIYEKDDNYYIEMDMPGFNKENINVDCDNGYLTVTANHEKKKDEEKKNYIRRERSYGSYQRQFYVGDITEDLVKAEFKHGILKIIVPKKEEINTKKKIEIE